MSLPRRAAFLALVLTLGAGARSASAQSSLRFDGVNDHVTFGAAPSLGTPTFTLEVWFKREGAGAATSSGTGGVTAVPLLCKGRGEADGDTRDMNWFLGIRSDNRLVADFEEGTGQVSPGLNHPVAGVTAIQNGVWYHAAATFDGTRWRLLLNGVVEKDTVIAANHRPQSSSTQHASLATALTSTGVAAGFFQGMIDEARVWNVARPAQGIRDSMNLQIATAAGLIGRWALDGNATSTVAGAPAGTLANGPAWSTDNPFTVNRPPNAPVLVVPANGATGVATSANLGVTASDPDGGNLTVTYYGRPAGGGGGPAGPDFTLIDLPDTQYYTGELNGGSNAIFKAQTQWIVNQKAARNIVDVIQLGDCTEHGDNNGNPIEWLRADSALKTIENPATTGLADGIPYSVCVGNHDQSPAGSASGTTNFFNQYFGAARFSGRSYYGGYYGSNYDNHYHLFSASGLDFIVVCMEYDTSPDQPVLDWADAVLAANPTRRAIVATHYMINEGNPGSFGAQGQAIYNALKDRPNLFLMLGGHVHTSQGEGRRSDVFEGRTVHTILADYQGRTKGGNGLLRIYEFSPANNVIRARTYSPWTGTYETDADSSSQFTIPYDMGGSAAFQVVATRTVASGVTASAPWSNLAANTQYEWYVTVSDGIQTVTGPTWRFTTGSTTPPPVATNLVGNPGFESNLSGWTRYNTGSLSRVTGGRTGSYALQISSSSSTATFGCDDSPNWIAATAGVGTVYRFAAYVRATSSRSKVRFRIYEYVNGVQQGTTAYSPDVTLSSSWQLVTVDYTVRSVGSNLSLRITETPTTSSRTFLVDDVSITRVSTVAVAALESDETDADVSIDAPTAVFAATLSPNPSHGTAALALHLTESGPATIRVFDLAGRQVAQPLDEPMLAPGRHRFDLDRSIATLRNGVYFYRVETREGRIEGRFAILR